MNVQRVIGVMWEREKDRAAFAARLWEERDRAREALRRAREKLEIYRAHSNGEYHGGMEHTALIRLIDEALK